MSQSIRGGLKHIGERQFSGPVFSDSLANKTSGPITMEVDYTLGTSPPAGTIVTSQDDYDELVAGFSNPYLKYPQDAVDILPSVLGESVLVNLAAGEHHPKTGNYIPSLGYSASLFIGAFGPKNNARFSTEYPTAATYANEIRFEGTMSVEEAEQAGTAEGKVITRSAGTWTVDEHKGRLVEIKTGASAGSRYVVRSNTATELVLVTTLSSGALTFEVVEPAAKMLGGIAGLVIDSTTLINLTFNNIDFGTLSSPSIHMFTSTARVDFNDCRFFIGDGYWGLQFIDMFTSNLFTCYLDMVSVEFGSYVRQAWPRFYYCYFRMDANDPYDDICFDVSAYGRAEFYKGVIEAKSGYADNLIAVRNVGELLIGHTDIDGAGTATAIKFMGGKLIAWSGAIDIQNCDTAVHVLANSQIAAEGGPFRGSGNTTAFKLEGGASLMCSADPTGLAATNEIDIDGEILDYTEVPNVGDWIEGAGGSRFIR